MLMLIIFTMYLKLQNMNNIENDTDKQPKKIVPL